jgi:hypothetical protein
MVIITQEVDPVATWDVHHADGTVEGVRLEERRIAGRFLLACIQASGDVVAYLQMDRVSSIRRREVGT